MAYDEKLAQRIREFLQGKPNLSEQKSFGGISFLLNGNMACGVIKEDLIVRVGPEAHAELLSLPHARPFDFTGRPMKGWLTVEPGGTATDQDLAVWVRRGVDFAASLPPKK
jgi:TfoX/Sxy family transcriptional regulator of competence genes